MRKQIQITGSFGSVSGLLDRPKKATAIYVFAHGAGAGMEHDFMEKVAGQFLESGIACLRFNFPYMEAGRRSPNSRPILLATASAAVAYAEEKLGIQPLFCGGKSMGGRMMSLAAADGALAQNAGLIFFGFPLHAAGKPSAERAGHLRDVGVPMLFLQGTRDRLADLPLLKKAINGTRSTVFEIEDGDHSFRVPKRSGRTWDDVIAEAVHTASAWIQKHSARKQKPARQR